MKMFNDFKVTEVVSEYEVISECEVVSELRLSGNKDVRW